MTNFNERTNSFISLTLYSRKGWCWLCVKGELETGTDSYILTQLHSSTSFSSWLGLLNRGSLSAQSPLSAAGSHFSILSPTDSNWLKLSMPWFILLRPPVSAVLPIIYTGASLDWPLGRRSICYNWPTTRPGCQNRKCTYVNNRYIRSRNSRV